MPFTALPLPPCELGESPFWHPLEKRLYWCDIHGFAVHAWEPQTGQHWRWSTPSEPGCCAPMQGGGVVLGLRDGFYALDAQTGAITCISRLPPESHDPQRLRLNDGRCDRAGRFWAGSVVSPRTQPDAALWRLDCRSAACSLQRMAGDNYTANGLAFSPDEHWLYWANTPAHRIDRFAFDAASGSLGARTPWVQFALPQDGVPYGGRPDGASVDAQGNYWVAMFEGACVLQLSPAGEVLQRLATPVQCPTMVCFGDEDLRTLYVTSARRGRPPEECAAPAPVPAGALLRLRVRVPGLPVNFFRRAPAAAM